ncbi:Mitochondrial substrate carrier family protein ucpB [Grifola frondosa]|uniref:Mitochondrial substrate carrier family protein ucpB n=1 Tax=Grifola frondosa TaxID=5627 RepID=A0A1C7LRN0_GRIFR|nr:Mitochondrial substrate carrier family protein ucpB [Grifola frondosa]
MSSAVTVSSLEKKATTVLDGENPRTSQYVQKFVGAAISNMAASAVSNPLDIIKVRQQLRTQTPGARANAFWSVGIEMARTEGILSLMNGFSASMWREVVYSGLRLGSYEYFKDRIYDASKGTLKREGITLKVMAATVAATIGSALANPADLVKGRSAQRIEFFQSCWRVAVALSRRRSDNHPWCRLVGITDMFFDQIKQSLKRRGIMHEGVPLHFVASMFAGLFCSITSNPVDVVKVRLMNDKSRELNGVLDCVKKIMIQEGPLAFFKGFGMCWARLGTHTIVTFLIFERVRLLFGIDAM